MTAEAKSDIDAYPVLDGVTMPHAGVEWGPGWGWGGANGHSALSAAVRSVPGAEVFQFPVPGVKTRTDYDRLAPFERYNHTQFNESQPERTGDVQTAWRVHAESYEHENFVTHDAIDSETGFLKPHIDKSRGDFTQYYLARHPVRSGDISTMRKIHVPNYSTYREWLPAYKLSEDGLSELGASVLDMFNSEDRPIVEIAALAKTQRAHTDGLMETIRRALYESIYDSSGEVWLFSVVSKTHDFFVQNWGAGNLPRIGADITFQDEEVQQGITLRPAFLTPNTFHDILLATLERERGGYLDGHNADPRRVARLSRNFKFFTDGLDLSLVSDFVRSARQEMDEHVDVPE